MEEKNNKFLVIITILTIVFTITGGTLAYWGWSSNTSEQTNVVFTIGRDFSCAADGGGNITNTSATIVPTVCTDPDRAIQRTVTVTPMISKDGLTIDMDLWLDINTIAPGLANSRNFKYALTTEDNSCTDGVVSTGNFYGKANDGRVSILNKSYTRTDGDIEPETYYLYIWLDKYETSSDTMNQTFNLSLGGNCNDHDGSPEAPVLDDGMIPVTIASDGTVTTVSEDDSSWYDYDNKEWANVVLVNTDASEEDGSKSRSEYLGTAGVEVHESDILAYYVWIPRYKYKIPYTKCSDIPESERNMEDYPECYAPYSMSDSDKEKLSIYFENESWCDDAYDAARVSIDYALYNGKFLQKEHFLSASYGTSIVSWVNAYNMGMIEDCGNPTGTLTLISSEFNGNNTLNGMDNEVSIDIAFESSTSHISKGNAVDTYYSHPAFIWDGETIPGIWVGKFETSPELSSDCYTTASSTNCNNTTQNPRIIPDVSSLRYQYVGNQFKTSLNFANGTMSDSDGTVTFAVDENNIYGLNTTSNKTDSHMMKNSEWGAVAYLSHSKYGINSELYINNTWGFTGRSSGEPPGDSSISSSKYGSYTWLGESVSSGGELVRLQIQH